MQTLPKTCARPTSGSSILIGLAVFALQAACAGPDGATGGPNGAADGADDSQGTGGLADSVGVDSAQGDTGGEDADAADGASPEDTNPADTTPPEDTAPADTTPPEETSPADTTAADTTPGACTTSADCQQPATGCLGNVCLAGTCTPQTLADGSPCDDGSACTAKAACAAGTCAATASIACDDGNPCTTDACDPKSGACTASPVAAGAACDDGDACISGTTCDASSACGGGVTTCGCQSLSDCAAFDDGDPCNGTLYCDLSATKPSCKVLPSSVVVCDPSLDSACVKTACSAFTGTCEALPLSDGSACDDGNPCTKGDACASGGCASEANTCQCQIAADCVGYEDGNVCNGTLYCDKSGPTNVCKVNPASIVACPKASGPCQLSACQGKTGTCKVSDAPDGSACEDGSAKTVGDACKQGVCAPGQSVAQCDSDDDCAKWEDGDFCNGLKFCNKATGLCQDNPATVVVCPTVDNTACSTVTCQPKSGLCLPIAAPDGKPCDDGDSCSAGDACAEGKCQASASVCECKADGDCKAKEDGDLCNGTLYCDKTTSACALNKATIVTCQTVDDGPCSVSTCAPKTGACAPKHAADGKACDDGSPCSADDACKGGACVGTKTCACTEDADCAAQDDGDLCNGTLYCNKKGGSCEVNPATLKVCPTVNDTACAKTQCQPKTGACALVPTSNGVACDADGNPCTKNDFCSAGVCKAGATACECYVDDDCAGLAAGNKCVQAMICDKASFQCKPGKQVVCDTSKDGACSATSCDPMDGVCKLALQPVGTLCGESAICAGAQVCDSNGACVPGAASDCDDADACTKDACDAKKGCTFAPLDSGACDDGSVCSDLDACSKGKCVGTSNDCSDASPCTDDACDPAKGCVHLPSAATSCDDGDLCSVGDFCLQGLCLPGSKVLGCDDGNPCTNDACDGKQGCVSKAQDGGKCDDDDGCTKLDACAAGSCKGVQLSCDDGSGCTVDSCDKDEGCQHKAQVAKACDDGNACTVGDACISSGLCASGQPKVCDDANPCTVDLCDPLQGCVQKEVVGSKCDDGNACTVNEKCDKGQCTGSPRDCDDGLVCSKDSCDKDAGCQYAVVAGSKCDDGNACTAGDACAKGGACVPGPGLSCDDNNGCTTDACDPSTGCTHKALDGIGCSDGDSCTQADKCVQGACKGSGKSCDDGLVCTTDGCDPAGGCTHKVQSGATCSDSDACTSGDACLQSGYCKPGAPVSCDDGKDCTVDACLPQKGCQQTTKTGAACDDDNACTKGDACSDKAVCVGSPLSCDDGKACTTDSCDKLGGCKNEAQTDKPCDDGNACSIGDVCLASGVCSASGLKSCADSNGCTLDSCDPKLGCVNAVQDKASCDDGSACTAGDACVGSNCVGSPVACDDGQSCTKDSCDKAKGCVATPQPGTTCTDANACTQGDLCSAAGTCVPGAALACVDGVACTTDACNKDSGCTYNATNGAACNDNDACTTADLCAGTTCKGTPLGGGSVASCEDNNACTTDSCDVKTGCKNVAKTGSSCSDGSACTGGDLCTALGKCLGTKVTCNDNSVCTLDLCDVDTGCVFIKLSGPSCNDNKLCTLNDLCTDGVCGGVTKACDDGNECTTDSCDATKDCQNVASPTKPCNDGDECTTGDACADAACKGIAKNCGDGNDCTIETCHKLLGCQSTVAKLDAACTDGDACTADWCDGIGSCLTTPQLGSRSLPLGYRTEDMAVGSDGVIWVVGAADTEANGAFIARIPWAGKQPPLQLDNAALMWNRITPAPANAKQPAGFVVVGRTGDPALPIPAYLNKPALGARFSETGKIIAKGWIEFKGATFDMVDEVAVTTTHMVFAAGRYGATANGFGGWYGGPQFSATPNGVFVMTTDTQFSTLSTVFWPSGLPASEHVAVNGLHVTGANKVAVLVATTDGNKARTKLLLAPIADLTQVHAVDVWSAGLHGDTGWDDALRDRMMARSDGGFDLFFGSTDAMRFNSTGIHVASAKASNSVPFQPLRLLTRRGAQLLAVTSETPPILRVMGRSLDKLMHSTTLLTAPVLMETGPNRSVYFLQRSYFSGLTLDSVERRDPWGHLTCTSCLTQHAAGCAQGSECATDSCNLATGQCASSVSASNCADGNACTVETCVDGKCVHTPAQPAEKTPCALSPSLCKSGTGTCGTGGVCEGTTTPAVCSTILTTSPECTDTRCIDANGCVHGAHPISQACKYNKVSPTSVCANDQGVCTPIGTPTVVASSGPIEDKHSISVPLADFSKVQTAFAWLRLEVEVEIVFTQLPLKSMALNDLSLVLGVTHVRLRGPQATCLTDKVSRSCFPILSSKATYVFPDDGVDKGQWNQLFAQPPKGVLTLTVDAEAVVRINSWKLTYQVK